MAEDQRCIVHVIINTLKYVSYKDKKEFAGNLKKIYHAFQERIALEELEKVSEKWAEKYPIAMKT